MEEADREQYRHQQQQQQHLQQPQQSQRQQDKDTTEGGRRVVLQKLIDEQEFWLRLTALLFYYLEDLYKDLLHKVGKLPSNPKELFTELCKNKHRVEGLLKRQKITQQQYDLIYPRNKKTEIWRFDISTFVFIVRYFTNIKPKGGWKLVNKLDRNDKSKGALLIEIEHFITENIEGSEPIMQYCFDELWSHVVYFLKAFKLDVSEVAELKRCPLKNGAMPERYSRAMMKAQTMYLNDSQMQIQKDLLILQFEDELCENKEDISKLLDESRMTEEMVLDFAEQVHSGHLLGTDLYSKLHEINKRLEQTETEMKFLKQMIAFEKTANSCKLHEHSSGHDEKHSGEGEDSIDSSFDKQETDANEKKKLRYRDAQRRLKSEYANKLSRDDQDNDFDCCLQAYESLELLMKTQNKDTNKDVQSFISYKEDFTDERKLFSKCRNVLLRGVPGSGKSYLIRKLVSDWVQGCLFTEVQFLFVIDYKDMRTKIYDTISDLIAMMYPAIFKVLTWQEMTSVPNQVMVLIDNWELFCEYGYIQPEETEFIRCIYKALVPNGQLSSHRVLIATRPESMEVITDNMSTIDFSIVNILGFSENTVATYISNFFSCNRKMHKVVKQKLQGNEHMRNAVKLPINLWSFCCVHQHNPNVGTVTSLTELYFNKLVMMLQENMQEPRKTNRPRERLYDNGVIASSMIEAAQCSYQSLTTTSHIQSPLKPIQELLTSIYLFMLNVSPLDVLLDNKFKGCLPFLASLHGSSTTSPVPSTTLTSCFVQRLDVTHNPQFLNQLFLTFIAPYKKVREYHLGNEFMLFLQTYYEYQGYLVQNEQIKQKNVHMKLHDMHLVDVSYLVYFLNHEHYQLAIQSIEIHTHEPISQKQLEQLTIHLLAIPKVTIDIKSFGQSSETLHHVFESYHDTNEFEVRTKELLITQAYQYDFQYAVNFDWLVFLNHFHLSLKTMDTSYLIASLENVLPRSISMRHDVKLTHLKLTLRIAMDAIPNTIMTLIKHFMCLKELQLVFTQHDRDEDYLYISIGKSHRSLEEIRKIELPVIKYAIYKALHQEDQIMPNNLQRIVIRGDYCSYEFLMSAEEKNKIALVVDKDENNFVDVELMTF